jgi:hypothetical protein
MLHSVNTILFDLEFEDAEMTLINIYAFEGPGDRSRKGANLADF